LILNLEKNMKIERLGAEHYDEILGLLNAVFGRKNGKEMNFELEMPKMCARDDEHMSKHFGIFDGGRLVACMGVYPFDAFVFGKHDSEVDTPKKVPYNTAKHYCKYQQKRSHGGHATVIKNITICKSVV
jgi:hypothetical protein